METAKLLGYYTTSYHEDANPKDDLDHDTGDTTYHFVIDLNGGFYEFTAEDSYGSCGSGWTSASWGYIHNELVKIDTDLEFISKLNVSIKDIFVNVHNNMVQINEKDSKESYDAMETIIFSTEGDLIVSGTGNGGCCYYPSGGITLNEELFQK